MATQEAEPEGVSFLRGMRILTCVAEAGTLRADQIAVETEVPLSTVYRYLKTLRSLELLEEHDGSYVAGWRLLELSGQHLTHTRLVELGHAFLTELSTTTGETAVLTVRVGTRAMCLRQVESHHPLRVAFAINQLLPLYAGAGQRMLLAYAPDAVIQRVLEHPHRQLTPQTLSRTQLNQAIEPSRRAGFLVSHAEMYDGALAVAVPVFAHGEVVCSLTAAGLDSRCSARWVSRTRRQLQASSERFSEALEDRLRRPSRPEPS